MNREKPVRQTRVEQTYHHTDRLVYGETVAETELERVAEREVSVSFNEKRLCVEQNVPADTPNGSEIDPAGGPMRRAPRLPPPQFPRLSGDRTDEHDA